MGQGTGWGVWLPRRALAWPAGWQASTCSFAATPGIAMRQNKGCLCAHWLIVLSPDPIHMICSTIGATTQQRCAAMSMM